MRNWLIDKATKFLMGEMVLPALPVLAKDTALKMFADLYQNPAFKRFLDAREEYLIKKGMEDFLAGKLNKTEGMAGQLLEIRNLRSRARAAYVVVDRLNKQGRPAKVADATD